MAERQLRLFKHPKPLLERFGRDFFRAVPTKPGVYIMSSETGRILYVGRSKNLRVRLATYKNAHPDHVARKIIRLVHAVRKIVWEECESVGLACVRENELLRTHRPKFNTVNTYPKAYCFIGLRIAASELTLSWTTEEGGGDLYGAFKRRSVQGYAALLRLLWAARHQPASPHDFPRLLLNPRPPRQFGFDLQSDWRRLDREQMTESLQFFFTGESAFLIDLLAPALPALEQLSPFHQAMQLADLETLADFFQYGPRRNRDLKAEHGLQSPTIPQEKLDDLLVLSREAAAQKVHSQDSPHGSN